MRSIKSVTYWKDIIIRELNYTNVRVTALSVSFDGKLLLAATTNAQHIYVYSTTNGSHVTTLYLFSSSLIDLAWTRRGNVVYTAAILYENETLSSEVVTMSLNGSFIARTFSMPLMFTPIEILYQSVSVSTDGAIYLTVARLIQKSEVATQHYVYESIDEGVTWSVVFKMPEDNHHVMVATKVSTDPQSLVFWSRAAALKVRENKLANYTVRVYTGNKRRDVRHQRH
jgi:hypothetical protein